MNYLLLRKLPEGLWLSNSCWKKWEEFVDFMYTYVLLHMLKHMHRAVKWVDFRVTRLAVQRFPLLPPRPPAAWPRRPRYVCVYAVERVRVLLGLQTEPLFVLCDPAFFTAKSRSRSAGAKREEVARTSCFIWKSVFQSNRLHVRAYALD